MTRKSAVTKDIAKAAVDLLKQHWNPDKEIALRTISVAVSNLEKEQSDQQQDLFEKDEKSQKIDDAMDVIRGKYGFASISRANYFGSDFINDKPYDDDEDLLPFKRG